MDLSGDLFDILPRCFNMDTLVQCLAGRRVISDAEYERIRSTGKMELSNIIRKNGAFKNFITAIREFTFEIIGVLQLAMDTALRPASEQRIKRPAMPHATEHFTSREQPGFTDLSQLDACQNSQESTSSTEVCYNTTECMLINNNCLLIMILEYRKMHIYFYSRFRID